MDKDIRPTKKQMKAGIENGWEGNEVKTGYGIFEDNLGLTYIARIDDMDVFDSDDAAAAQAKRDGYKFIKLTKKLYQELDGIIGCEITRNNLLDTQSNRDLIVEIINW